MEIITIYRLVNSIATPVLAVKPAASSSISKHIMGDNSCTMVFSLNHKVDFYINDYADVFGERYKLNKDAQITKQSAYDYDYTLVMQSEQFDLAYAQYLFYDSYNVLREGDFSLTGTATTFIDLLISNMGRIENGWVKGGVIATDYKTLSFSKEDCLTVLAKIAAAFNTEFFVEGKTVHLAPLGRQTTYLLRNGRSKGLYDITRSQVDSQTIVTRLYAFGAAKNLPANYPSQRLRLPGGYSSSVSNINYTAPMFVSGGLLSYLGGGFVYAGGTRGTGITQWNFHISWTAPSDPLVTATRLQFRAVGSSTWTTTLFTTAANSYTVLSSTDIEFRILSLDASGNVISTSATVTAVRGGTGNLLGTGALPFLECNTGLYGIREGDFITDDIYPHRTGTVTAIGDMFTFTDATMDFDLNATLVPGVAAKLTFVSGQLSGYTFELFAYTAATKTFTILKNKDEKTIDLPNEFIHPEIGDSYVLTDIFMPAIYVQQAELLLQAKAQAFLDANCSPAYTYSITCDPSYFRRNLMRMKLGDIIYLQDVELYVDRYIRIISLTKSLLDEFEYTLELGDIVSSGFVSQIQTTLSGNASDISNTQKLIENNKLLNGLNIGNLTISMGTLVIQSIPTGTGVPVKIDSAGNLCI